MVGGILFGNSFFFYLAVACAVALYWYLNKTRSGLYLRSVGESPATADAAGINVTRYKYLATVIGGGVSAQQKLLIEPIAEKVKASVMPAFAEGLEIRAAQLHNDAGMVGAVYYFRQTMEKE